MAERDGATVRVYVLRVLGKPEFAEHCDALGGKWLVEFRRISIA